MCSNEVLSTLDNLIISLEQNQNDQTYVDNIYTDFTAFLEKEINKYLNLRKVIKIA